MDSRRPGGVRGQPRALRLTFSYQGDEVRLVGRRSVEMIAPSTGRLGGDEGEQGFWVEVRSDNHETLHRSVMEDPLRRDIEVFSPDPGRSMSRAPVEKPSGMFVVVIPEFEEADHVALMSSGAPGAATRGASPEAAAGTPAGPAAELARFSLRSGPAAEALVTLR